jgi:CDP-diacylglycerol---glycerol-3-phosphate 3-phosphatidyltransferase
MALRRRPTSPSCCKDHMNLPNQLTLGRLALTVIFVAFLSLPPNFTFHGVHFAALGIFLLATLTDYLDGVIARRAGLITDFGKLMDPLADKILTASALILLIPLGALPAWVVIVIVAREFLITGLRVLANAKGILLPAERLGKHKTAWQMITIIYFLLLLAIRDFVSPPPDWWHVAWSPIGLILVAITTLLTVYSGVAYLWKHQDLIADH